MLPPCISVLMMINIPSRCQVQDKPFPHNSQDEKQQLLIMSRCLWFLLSISGNKETGLAQNKWLLELFHVTEEWSVSSSGGGGPYMWAGENLHDASASVRLSLEKKFIAFMVELNCFIKLKTHIGWSRSHTFKAGMENYNRWTGPGHLHT